MIDLKKFRQDPTPWIESAKKRGLDLDFDYILKLDEKVRNLKNQLNNLLAERKKLSAQIPQKQKAWEDISELVEKVKSLKEEIASLQQELDQAQEEFNKLVLQIPNVLADDVPVGADDSENVVMYTWGEKPKFDFQPLPHREILEKRDLLDSKRAVKIAGSRFVFFKDKLALLEMALMQFVMHKLYKKWFKPLLWPNLVNERAMYWTGYLPAGEDGVYKIEWEDLYLIWTSEVSSVSQHMDEVLDVNDLPKRYVSYSTCYRKEAGSYWKDLKWLIRLHQFNKVEMVSFVKPEDSWKEHELLVEIEEEILQDLWIPYQKMLICSGDLWNPAAKKYDLEGWFPGIWKYKELTSTSNTLDYQARRINCKYMVGREKEFVHILNWTWTSDRPVAAIVENYQTKDMRIIVPEVLRPYMMGIDII